MTHTSTETHIHKDGKIRYNIPAEVFKDNLTATGDFQYDTDYKQKLNFLCVRSQYTNKAFLVQFCCITK